MLTYLPKRSLAQRSAVFRLLLEYNPFYLLSAMFMLAGLFSLNDSLDWSPLPAGNLIILVATLNLYELLLIAMAIFLYRRGVKRDATMLLMIEAFFLVDAGFLNAEIVTQDLMLGLIVNLILLVLGVVKVAVIFRALGLPIVSGPYVLIVVQLAVLAYAPGVLKSISLDDARHGSVPATAMYALWWVVGLVVALYGLFLRRIDFSDAPRIERFGRHRTVVAAMLMLGFVSILAHLCTSNWVYDVRWYTANLAPVLLGIASAAGLAEGVGLRYRPRRQMLVALPLAAILISAPFPSALVFGPAEPFPLTPLRVVLIGSAAVYLLGLVQFRELVFAFMSAGCLLLAALGSSVAAMVENIMLFNRSVATTTRNVVPKRTADWGMVSVCTAFVLLAVGLVLSIKKSEEQGEAKAE